MNDDSLTLDLKAHALSHGIDLIGITTAEPFTLRDATGTSIHPKELLGDARSIVVVAFYSHDPAEEPPVDREHPRGRFPRAESLRALVPMSNHCIETVRSFLARRGYAATPNTHNKIPEKMAAARAGLGKYGKNAVLLTREYGARVRWESFATNAPLACEKHDPYTSDCGDCDLCLKACPTGAIYEPFRVKRELCITDWLWGAFVPIPLRERQENRIFGCGECLEACPRNKELIPRKEYPVRSDDVARAPELIPLVTGDEETFRRTLPSFPMLAGIDAIRGNAIIALGNLGARAAVEPLCTTLTHPKPQIRAYSAWALGKIGGARAGRALEGALQHEGNQDVRMEIRHALGQQAPDLDGPR